MGEVAGREPGRRAGRHTGHGAGRDRGRGAARDLGHATDRYARGTVGQRATDVRPLTAPKPLRWEIWRFDLRKHTAADDRGPKPCLIVSGDGLNRSTFGTVLVCPITTSHHPSFQWRVKLEPSDLLAIHRGWERWTSWVQTDQVVTVESARAIEKLASLRSVDRQRQVKESLRLILDL